MPNPTPTASQLEAARYAAWRRMRIETRAILTGDRRASLSADHPHVAAWIAADARYRVDAEQHARNPHELQRARQARIAAESAYVDAILPEEIERILDEPPRRP